MSNSLVRIFISTVSVLFSAYLYAQEQPNRFHYPKEKSVQVMIGKATYSKELCADYKYLLTNKWGVKAGFSIDKVNTYYPSTVYGNGFDYRLNYYTVRVGGIYSIAKLFDRVYINAATDVYGGISYTTSNEIAKEYAKQEYIIGIRSGADMDIYLSNHFSIPMQLYMHYLTNKTSYFTGYIGIRYIMNN